MSDSRRKFLAGSMTGASTAWVAANWPAVAATAETASQKSKAADGFTFFSRSQAAEIDAMSGQIFPTTDTPGAKEAQVVYFIDLALASFAQDAQSTYTKGFVALQAKTSELFPGAASFAALTSAQQIQLLTAIQNTDFFRAVRNHTMMGMFAAPQHGGNYNKVGWKLIGFEDNLSFKPPFGYYDR